VINLQLWKEVCLGRETLQMCRALWSAALLQAPPENLCLPVITTAPGHRYQWGCKLHDQLC